MAEMERATPLLPSPHGFKRFFPPQSPSERAEIGVRGLGLRELMPPLAVQRPGGTCDYLFMLFHDPAFVGSAPTVQTSVPPDTMIVWEPGHAQYYGNREARFSHSWLHCSGPRVRRILRATGLPVGRPFPMPDVTRFQQCLSEIHAELVSHVEPDFQIIGNLLENCLLELARRLAGSGAGSSVAEPLLTVRRLISTAPAQKMTLADMARAAGMSTSSFSSGFKKTFGLSPKAYLLQHRMRHAAHLLANRNLTVSEIAAQVGYDDLFHFSKTFKRHFGVSPRNAPARKASKALRSDQL